MSHIYMDHSATTPVHPEVVEAMLPYWTESYGNPASGHAQGRRARQGLDWARETVAEHLGARPAEIVFTGCGSESDNLAIRGVLGAARDRNAGNHVIVSAIEHPAVLETGRQLADRHGFACTVVGVDEHGRVDPAEVAAAIRPETALISIMAANNEVGTIQPFLEIGALARERGILFHTDAIQAAGYMAWDMRQMPIDLMSLAPHKFHGPKGVGMLYVRDGVTLVPSMTGGGQEEGRRPGTVNVPLAVGAAKALAMAMERRASTLPHLRALRDQLIDGILDAVPESRLTGHPTERLPHHASFAFRHVNGNDLLINLDMAGVAGSSGSACSTGNPKPSAILQAMGFGDEWALGGLRLTVGEQNSMADAERATAAVAKAVKQLRAFAAATMEQ
jgi:cysteine desulfurase